MSRNLLTFFAIVFSNFLIGQNFISTWAIPSDSYSLELPLKDYTNITIDWGDSGSTSSHTDGNFPTHAYATAGTYTISIMVNDAEKEEVFISEDIHYYPNPTKDDVRVHIGGEDSTVMVSVFSEKGSLIYQREQQVQDVSRLTEIDLALQITGTYIVTLEGPTVRKTFKVIRR